MIVIGKVLYQNKSLETSSTRFKSGLYVEEKIKKDMFPSFRATTEQE